MAELDEGLEASGSIPQVLTFGTPSVGEILAERYQLEEHIGNDSLGRQLYRGIDVILRRPVAVVLRYPGGDSAKEMLGAAVAASRIVHPHLVGVYDAIDEGERAYVVREWVDGIALREIVASGPLDAGRSVAIAWAVTDAVASLHGTGMAHGNVHPGTVLVAHDGRVVLTDARADDGATPETDIRAIGAILYCALTGYWPHAEAGTYSVPDGVRDSSGALTTPRQVRAGVPAHLDSLVADLLNPDLPLPSAESLGGELASFGSFEDDELEDEGRVDFDAFDSAAASPTPPKPAGRKLAVGVVGLLVLALAGTLAAARVLGDPAQPDTSPTTTTPGGGTNTSQQAKPAGQPTEFKIDPSKVRIVDPVGDGKERKDAQLLVDGDLNTVWKTNRYVNKANFGGLKDGMGVLLDLGEAKQVVNVEVKLQTPGADGDLRSGAGVTGGDDDKAADQQIVTSFQVVGQPKQNMGPTTVFNGPDAKTQYLLLWITKLPKDGTGYRVSIGEIIVRVQ